MCRKTATPYLKLANTDRCIGITCDTSCRPVQFSESGAFLPLEINEWVKQCSGETTVMSLTLALISIAQDDIAQSQSIPLPQYSNEDHIIYNASKFMSSLPESFSFQWPTYITNKLQSHDFGKWKAEISKQYRNLLSTSLRPIARNFYLYRYGFLGLRTNVVEMRVDQSQAPRGHDSSAVALVTPRVESSLAALAKQPQIPSGARLTSASRQLQHELSLWQHDEDDACVSDVASLDEHHDVEVSNRSNVDGNSMNNFSNGGCSAQASAPVPIQCDEVQFESPQGVSMGATGSAVACSSSYMTLRESGAACHRIEDSTEGLISQISAYEQAMAESSNSRKRKLIALVVEAIDAADKPIRQCQIGVLQAGNLKQRVASVQKTLSDCLDANMLPSKHQLQQIEQEGLELEQSFTHLSSGCAVDGVTAAASGIGSSYSSADTISQGSHQQLVVNFSHSSDRSFTVDVSDESACEHVVPVAATAEACTHAEGPVAFPQEVDKVLSRLRQLLTDSSY